MTVIIYKYTNKGRSNRMVDDNVVKIHVLAICWVGEPSLNSGV